MSKPRVLLTTRNLPPLQGGMERLNRHLAEELAVEFELHVCGPAGAEQVGLPARSLSTSSLKSLWRFLIGNFVATIWRALEYRPALVLAGSGLTAPAALVAARVCGARCAAYLHGLDIVVDSALYRRLWHPVLRRLDGVFVNSHSTGALARAAGIKPDRISVLFPGVDWPPKTGCSPDDLRSRFGLGDAPLLLSVGRLTARKGLAEFVTKALPKLLSSYPTLRLIVIGSEPQAALSSRRGEQQRIEEAASAAGVGSAVRLLGALDDSDVVGAMQASRVLIFPVVDLPGDTEGFGMVAVEAASQGLPTVAFRVGGVVDAVADGCSGDLIRAGDYEQLIKSLLHRLRGTGPTDLAAECLAHAKQFAWPEFGAKLRSKTAALIASTGAMP